MISFLSKTILYTFSYLLIFIIISSSFLYLYDRINSFYTIPKVYRNLNIEFLKKLDFDYFKNNHGDIDILITESEPDMIDMYMYSNIKKVKMRDYCEHIMKTDPKWYFKAEDVYDFFELLGIKNDVVKHFDKIFNKYGNVIYKDISFWMGAKTSTTGWHTDLDDLSYLYVIKGKKIIKLISPKYDYAMYEKKIFTPGAKWSNINFKDVNYDMYPNYKDVVVTEYILNEGDCIYIPKHWWHCVENLEDSIAVTYKIYRSYQTIYTTIAEQFREIYYSMIGCKITNIEDIKRDNITPEEYEEYKKIIFETQ